LSALGAFAESRRHGKEALCLATREGAGGSVPITVQGYLGVVYLTQGDLEPAIQACEQALARCRVSGERSELRLIMAGLGYAYALRGRLVEGCALLEEAIKESLSIGANLAYRVVWLSEVCRLAGRGEDAWQHAHQALALARELKARGDEALALHQIGVVQAHAAPPDVTQAAAYYQEALILAEELGMRPLVAHCHHGLGRLYATMGLWEQAHAALCRAIALYREMEMAFWLPQAEAALAELAHGPHP